MAIKAFIRVFEISRIFHYYRIDEIIEEGIAPRKLPSFFKWHIGKRIDKNIPRGKRLNLALEELGPIFIKIGQLLSTRPDLFEEDISQSLSLLQENVSAFDTKEAISIVERDLKKPISELYASFDEVPLASASIAQVHRATLFNGNKVVVKIKRPNVKEEIIRDLRWLHLFAKLLEFFIKPIRRFKPIEVIKDLEKTLNHELDFQREAANANQLARNFENSPLLYVPHIYWEHTKNNVITMEEIFGVPVTDLETLNAHHTNLQVLSERGVEIFFTQVFRDSFFHADMHPGNIYVDIKNPKLPRYFSLDCAIIGTLTQADQRYLAENLIAFFNRDYEQVARLHVESGWVPKETSVVEFESAIRIVCEPIFAKPLKDISFGQTLYNLFSVAKRFNMEVQPQLILLQKTLLAIEGLGRQLYPELDLWKTAKPYLEKWIKERYHPKHAFKAFRKELPFMMDLLPQLPKISQTLVQKFNEPPKKVNSTVPVSLMGSSLLISGAILIALGDSQVLKILASLFILLSFVLFGRMLRQL